MNFAPNSVSGRVVKTSISREAVRQVRISAKRSSRPSERPIQFFCISRTFSGQRSSVSSACQQILGIVGDLEEPLRQLALLDERARAPAAAVDHLLIGEHGVIDRVPIHLRLLAVDEARAQEVQEQLLLVAVIFRIAGRDLARPVERQADRLQLRAHRGDVVVGPVARDGALLCIAAFSAGRPKASQPIGCSTLKPLARLKRAMTSPIA